jgi:hypothetical protein
MKLGLPRSSKSYVTSWPAADVAWRSHENFGDWGTVRVMLTVQEARERLATIVDQLEALRLQVLGLQGCLPEPEAEKVRMQDVVDDEADPVTVLRALIDCTLNDSIEPALRSLRGILRYTEGNDQLDR